jgi:predicted ATP-binding protein involved in virulence
MGQIIISLEKSASKNVALPNKANYPKSKDTYKNKKEDNLSELKPDMAYIEWIINKPQADRIAEHLYLLNQYIENRKSLRNPIDIFSSLVNSFLEQTNKKVIVGNNGQLTIQINSNSEDSRSIDALSSGERQLLVMLAHLSLNPSLSGSGIFIVDEPELSLHIDWQEKFVDAIRKANPNVQLILATHSPAIILDRDEACIDLARGTV